MSDLTALPFPMMHVYDGGPYISGTFVVSRDAEYGRNAGSYRMMYRNRRETGIDLVSPSDMRFYYQRMLDKGEPLPIAVAVGVHPFEMLAASYKAPIASDELELAGGLHGAPVPMVKCRTVDLEVPADSEIVLEGEILPIGWTADEGPFGEFSQISGDVKWNPVFRVNCITHRRDPIFYSVADAVGERLAVSAPVTEAAGLQALRVASVEPVAIRAPVGSCGYWTLIASIRKRPGEGKECAARAALGRGGQARHRHRRRYRHQQPGRHRLGADLPGAGGPGPDHPFRRARQACRSQHPRLGDGPGRASADRQARHRRDHPRGHPEMALQADRDLWEGPAHAGGFPVSGLATVIEATLTEEPLQFAELADRHRSVRLARLPPRLGQGAGEGTSSSANDIGRYYIPGGNAEAIAAETKAI